MVEQVGFQEDLAVGDGNHVRRDVGGHVAGLGLDDRQSGQGTAAVVFGDAGGTLQQTAVEIEHVAGIRFAAGWALQDQGHLAVGDGVLGKVIEHDEGVLALVHEPLADGATGVRGEVLHSPRRRKRRR